MLIGPNSWDYLKPEERDFFGAILQVIAQSRDYCTHVPHGKLDPDWQQDFL